MYARQLIYNANKSLTTLQHTMMRSLCFKWKIDKRLTTIYHTQMVIHICYTLAHVVIYVRRTQILVSLVSVVYGDHPPTVSTEDHM